MAKKQIIRKNMEVIVIAGSHKGASGKVLSVDHKNKRIKIDKVNIVKKHVKPSQTNPDGGIQEFEAPIHLSNVKIKAKEKSKLKRILKPKEDKPKGKPTQKLEVKPNKVEVKPQKEEKKSEKPEVKSQEEKVKQEKKSQEEKAKQGGDK